MDELDFENRLRASAPRAAAPVGLAEHRQRIMAEVRGSTRRPRRVWVGAAIATAVLLGGGTVAVAGNGMETPWGWTADNVYSIPGPNGQTCFMGMQVMPDGIAADSEAMLYARDYVASIDIDALDTAAYEAERAADNGKPFDDGSPGTVFWTDAEIKQDAVGQVVADMLFAELRERGFANDVDNGPVSLSSTAMGCR